jgi:hypothetical protein
MSGLEILGALSAIAGLAGAGVSAAGTIAAGKAQQQAAAHQAAQMRIKAKEEHAAAQQQALQLKTQKIGALSNLQARAAASGFLEDADIGDEITEYGTFQEQVALSGGRARRQSLEDAARGAIATGQAQDQGAKLAAFGTILGGAGSMFDAFSQPFGAPTGQRFRYDDDQFAQVGLGRYY